MGQQLDVTGKVKALAKATISSYSRVAYMVNLESMNRDGISQ